METKEFLLFAIFLVCFATFFYSKATYDLIHNRMKHEFMKHLHTEAQKVVAEKEKKEID